MHLGLPELLIILLIVILIFGASRLGSLGRGAGQAIRGFKDEINRDKPKEQSSSEKD